MMDRKRAIESFLKEKSACIHMQGLTITDDQAEYMCSKINCQITQKIYAVNRQLSADCITHQGILNISRMNWSSLTQLILGENNIGDRGCKYLTKTYMPNIQVLLLYGNNIGNAGLLHISKSNWQKLNQIILSVKRGQKRDRMRVGGSQFLIRANWKNSKILPMGRESLTVEQLKAMFLCEFLLEAISIISDQGGMKSRAKLIQKYLNAKFPKARIYS